MNPASNMAVAVWQWVKLLTPPAWRIALLALVGAAAAGLQLRSWLAAGVGYGATFVVFAALVAVLLVAVKREQDRDQAAQDGPPR